MGNHTISVFNNTIKKTNDWLNDVMVELDWDEPKKAYIALRVVMHELRDLLSVEEVTDLAAQLPMLVRGFYFEGWNPNHKPKKIRHAEQFVTSVNAHFSEPGFFGEVESGESQAITRAVFKVLAKHVSAGEIKDVIACLPAGLGELWE